MKLTSVIVARSIWLFDIADLNPQGKSIYPEIIDWLKDEYHFSKFPKSVDDVDQNKGLVFTEGEFQVREEIFITTGLSIYSDGFVGNTQSSTADTDVFLQNVLNSAIKEFNLVFTPDMLRKRLYYSEVNVKLEGSMARINPKLSEIAERISSSLVSDQNLKFEFNGVGFGPDPADLPIRVSGFALERKVAAPYKENKYFSRAPLQTEKHLQVIEEIEKLMI